MMRTPSKRMARHRPCFDSLEARSLLSGEPFGVGPFVPLAIVTSVSARFSLGPDSIVVGASQVEFQVDFQSSAAKGPQSTFAFIAMPSPWHAPIEDLHEVHAGGSGDIPGLLSDSFNHGGSAQALMPMASSQQQTTPNFEPAGGEFTMPALLSYLAHDDSLPAPDAPTYAAPFLAIAALWGKPQTTDSASSDPVDLGGLGAGPQPGAQAALVSSGKGVESAQAAVPSSPVPTALSSSPARQVPLASSDPLPFDAPAAGNAIAGRPDAARVATASALPRLGSAQGASPIGSRLLSISRSDLPDRSPGDEPGSLPRPAGADLIASVLPFDRTSLERAVDRFFEQFDDVDVRDLVGQSSTRIVLFSLTLTSTVLALDVARRRWQRGEAGPSHGRIRDPLSRRDPLGFPELPGSWSSRLT